MNNGTDQQHILYRRRIWTEPQCEQHGDRAKRLEQQYPITNNGYGVLVIPIRRSYVGANVDRMGIVLMTAVGFVLLIMCANLANLMLVRGAARQRELAVRSAMGAGAGRLLWVALSESVLLAVPGTIVGLIASVGRDCHFERTAMLRAPQETADTIILINT